MNRSTKNPKPWTKKKEILKKQYSSLSDDDLIYEQGEEEKLIGRIQRKLGKSKQEVKRLIKRL
ncbi:hypothetical protein SAMN05443144_10926 [Fodinibius roseus]|uniref:CsbD-like n=1 Tax=Fodinibius roseus TaxID=1194090 RepID=A0A1M5BYD2_9BACT|nr:general stress protein CsbD [Fodinibius roseus]SHF47390.1 hypothetical protein SAMN05443144_10926 [Fodinibius roseus]